MSKKLHVPTRKDVAELAGVSETIVSYVINNNRYVSDEKRQRVLDAVRELHYRPNSIARSLKGKGSSHILFIADKIDNEYFGRIVREIDAVAYDKGYLISLMSVRNNQDFINRILSRQADAVIVSSTGLDDQYIQMLIDAGIPVVLLMTRDYATVTGEVSRIYTGNESGIMNAVHYMYDKGARHLVYVDRISQHGHFSNRSDMRYRGFCNQMEALCLPSDAIITHKTSYEEVYDAVCELIRGGSPADGFICRNDQMASIVVQAVTDCGKRVPDDISVIGFDNSSICTILQPQLSSIDMERSAIASAAIELIDSMIAGNGADERHFITRLVLRGTTR